MIDPWIHSPHIWKTKAAFFTWLRGSLRRGVWEKYPPKLEFKQGQGYKPDSTYTGKAKKLIRCALTGEEVAISKAEVDHINGNVSLQGWDDVLTFIQHLCASPDNLQVVGKEAHKIKSYAERMGISFDQASAEKEAIRIIKERKDREWLESRGIALGKTQATRRKQIVEKLLEENRCDG